MSNVTYFENIPNELSILIVSKIKHNYTKLFLKYLSLDNEDFILKLILFSYPYLYKYIKLKNIYETHLKSLSYLDFYVELKYISESTDIVKWMSIKNLYAELSTIIYLYDRGITLNQIDRININSYFLNLLLIKSYEYLGAKLNNYGVNLSIQDLYSLYFVMYLIEHIEWNSEVMDCLKSILNHDTSNINKYNLCIGHSRFIIEVRFSWIFILRKNNININCLPDISIGFSLIFLLMILDNIKIINSNIFNDYIKEISKNLSHINNLMEIINKNK